MKSILFTEPNLIATVEGRKTNTRRICGIQPPNDKNWNPHCIMSSTDSKNEGKWFYGILNDDELSFKEKDSRLFYPRYKVGEKLYLKEPYIRYQTIDHIRRLDGRSFNEVSDGLIGYKYDGHDTVSDFKRHIELIAETKVETDGSKWKNKLFMPESAARYFIEITDVRCERLQDISGEDCFREGIRAINAPIWDDKKRRSEIYTYYVYPGSPALSTWQTPREAYAAEINAIHGRGTWESNPFVWSYYYKLIK